MADVRDTMTERLLDDAGVGAGMRVLDVGCGQGEVSLMLARRVGAHGHVLGVDWDARALAAARARARDLGLAHVHFADADLDALAPDHAPFDAPFDAVVGRRARVADREVLRRVAANAAEKLAAAKAAM